MKILILRVVYYLIVLTGVIICFFAISKLTDMGISFFGKYDPIGKDSNFLSIIGIIGLVLIFYGIFQIILLKDAEKVTTQSIKKWLFRIFREDHK